MANFAAYKEGGYTHLVINVDCNGRITVEQCFKSKKSAENYINEQSMRGSSRMVGTGGRVYTLLQAEKFLNEHPDGFAW